MEKRVKCVSENLLEITLLLSVSDTVYNFKTALPITQQNIKNKMFQQRRLFF